MFSELKESGHNCDLETPEGLFNVLATCNLVILSNVLDRRTYRERIEDINSREDLMFSEEYIRYDRNSIAVEERREMSHFRGMAFNLLRWIARNFEITLADPLVSVNFQNRLLSLHQGKGSRCLDFMRDVAFHFLASQALKLVHYKTRIEGQISGFPGCNSDLLKYQVDRLLGIDEILKEVSRKVDLSHNPPLENISFDWPDKTRMSITRLEQEKMEPVAIAVADYMDYGTTDLDTMCFYGFTHNYPLRDQMMNAPAMKSINDEDEEEEHGEIPPKRKMAPSEIDEEDDEDEERTPIRIGPPRKRVKFLA